MKLLVSVTSADEARAAISGGATIVDVKDPGEGALGAPSPAVIAAVAARTGDRRRLSVALGDLPQLPHTAALAAVGAAVQGGQIVKVGLRGARSVADGAAMLRAVVSAVEPLGDIAVVAAGYADHARLDPPPLPPDALVAAAAKAAVAGCMLDTMVKDGSGLLSWYDVDALASLAGAARAHGLWFGVAGQLTLADLGALRGCGADLAGVRSAVCPRGDRSGRLSAALVAEAAAAVGASRQR